MTNASIDPNEQVSREIEYDVANRLLRMIVQRYGAENALEAACFMGVMPLFIITEHCAETGRDEPTTREIITALAKAMHETVDDAVAHLFKKADQSQAQTPEVPHEHKTE